MVRKRILTAAAAAVLALSLCAGAAAEEAEPQTAPAAEQAETVETQEAAPENAIDTYNAPMLVIGGNGAATDSEPVYFVTQDGAVTHDGANEDTYNIKAEATDAGYKVTLRNASFANAVNNAPAIFTRSALTLELVGENTISEYANITADGADVTITGDGTLTVHSTNENRSNGSIAAWGGGNLTIGGKAKITVKSDLSYNITGIRAKNITIADEADLTFESGMQNAVWCEDTFTMNGGTLTVKNSQYNAIRTPNYTQEGGTVSLSGAGERSLWVSGTMTMNGGKLQIATAGADAVAGPTAGSAYAQDIVLNGGSIDLTAASLCTGNDLTVNGGKLTAENVGAVPYAALGAGRDFLVTGGEVSVTNAANHGISARQDYSQTGGTVTLKDIGTAPSNNGYGKGVTTGGSVTVSDGTLTVENALVNGVFATDGTGITISGGTVMLANTGSGLCVYKGGMTLSGGKITIRDMEWDGISVFSGLISITGSTELDVQAQGVAMDGRMGATLQVGGNAVVRASSATDSAVMMQGFEVNSDTCDVTLMGQITATVNAITFVNAPNHASYGGADAASAAIVESCTDGRTTAVQGHPYLHIAHYVKPAPTVEMKVESDKLSDDTIPAALKERGYTTEKITAELKQETAKKLAVDNLVVYDVRLKVRVDGGEWVDATKESFPKNGLTVDFALPAGITVDTAAQYDFLISHMKDDGTVELLVPTLTDGKLTVTVGSLSPFGVSWKAKEQPKPIEQPTATPAPTQAPTATPAPTAAPSATAAPKPAATAAPTATPAPAAVIPQTADPLPLGLLVTLLCASAIGLTALVWKRKKN